jgi:hypothetical protein
MFRNQQQQQQQSNQKNSNPFQEKVSGIIIIYPTLMINVIEVKFFLNLIFSSDPKSSYKD